MIFFYVGIGFAMMTTVVAIFETSTNINKNQYPIRINKIDSDKILLQKQNDKKFLQILNDLAGISLGSGQLICQNIKDGYENQSNSNYSILSKYAIINNYKSGIPSYTSHNRLKNGCDLVYGFHRIVIVPSNVNNNSYNLYSCIIGVDPKCPFELVN